MKESEEIIQEQAHNKGLAKVAATFVLKIATFAKLHKIGCILKVCIVYINLVPICYLATLT